MECKCGYITDNNKSFSNHIRFGCPNRIIGLGIYCIICGEELIKKHQTGNQAKKFCSQKCYGDWRSENKRGINAPNYIHGKSNDNLLFRASREYKHWRLSVFKRDNFTCVICGDNKGGNLEADHIKDFALYPNLRLDVNNGRTLCRNCHIKTENYGFKKSNSKKKNQIQSVGQRT